MKKSILLLLLCLFYVSFLNAQLPFVNLNKYKRATIFFKDGSKKIGLAKLTNDNLIKFKIEKKKKAQKLDFKQVDKISLRIDLKKTTFQYKTIEGDKNPTLLEIIDSGKITLYKTDHTSQFISANANNDLFESNPNNNTTIIKSSRLYVCREGEKYVSELDRRRFNSKHFTKAALEYFKDCPALVQMIKNEELKKRALIEMVEFYNEECN